MSASHEEMEAIAAPLRQAWPLGGHDFVTHMELDRTVVGLRLEIQLETAKLQRWILGAALGIVVAFGGGYVSLVSKIDRLTEALPVLISTQEGRRTWNMHQDQRLDRQDDALRQIKPGYESVPYKEPPR